MFSMRIFFIGIFFCSTVCAQQQVRGRVMDGSTGSPLAGCSIFISGSSLGTVSGTDGSFIISGIPRGKHEMIVSFIGYQTYIRVIQDGQLPLDINISLQVKAQELELVLAEPYSEDKWDQWGQVFIDNFLGTMPEVDRCRILNTKAIRFRYYKKSKRLKAFADEPVLIENDLLGYRISFQMEEFELNFTLGTTYYLGYSLFEEIGGKGNKAMARKEENRRKAYQGSVMHFMRALYSNQLSAEGFEIRRVQRNPNTEKQRVKEVYRKAMNQMKDEKGVIVVGPGISTPGIDADSAVYYRKVMLQPDQLDIYSDWKITGDSLIIARDTALLEFQFPDYIEVSYLKALEVNEYLMDQHLSRKRDYRRSMVNLFGGSSIVVNRYGNYYNPQDFVTLGYWAWSEKMANALPIDYKADE